MISTNLIDHTGLKKCRPKKFSGADTDSASVSIEQALVDTLAEWGIDAAPRADAPGVYTGERKIASLGLRIRHGRSFHGLALNIDMDLEPFRRINPCGYAGMEMTQMVAETSQAISVDLVSERLAYHLQRLIVKESSGMTNESPE